MVLRLVSKCSTIIPSLCGFNSDDDFNVQHSRTRTESFQDICLVLAGATQFALIFQNKILFKIITRYMHFIFYNLFVISVLLHKYKTSKF